MKREPTKPIVVALCMLVLAACSAEDKGSSQNALTGGKGGSDYVPPRAGSSAGSGGGGSGGSAGAAKAGRGAMTPVGDFAKAVATLAPIAPPGAAVAGAGGAAGTSAGAGGMAAGAGGMTAGAGGAMMAGAGGMTAGAGGRSGAGGSGGRGGAGASGRGGSSGRGGTSGRGGSGGAGGMSATSGAGGAGGAGAAGTGVAGAGGAGAGGAGAGGAGSASSAPLTGPQGSVTFTNLGASVEVSIAITQCQSGKSYPIHIHSGMSCADEMSQGGHWDPPRGEGIPDVPCTNAIGMVLTQRDASDDKPWTVGGSEATNVIGHVVVLHDPEMPMKRIACGEIKAAK